MREKLKEQIRRYNPVNEQEKLDKMTLLDLLNRPEDISIRENLTGHLTASAWVVSPERRLVLMAYHRLYDSWAWLGGHADGDWDLCRVAEKEAREESGIENLVLVSPEPVSLEILTVNGHEKKGKYVPSHLHLNLTYLFEADPMQMLRCKPDENSGVAWFTPEQALASSTEPWMVERVYRKLTERAKAYME